MNLDGVPKFRCLCGITTRQMLKIRCRNSLKRPRLYYRRSVGMTFLQQLQQPPCRDVALQYPWPELRCLSVTHDLRERASTERVAFYREYRDVFTRMGAIRGMHARGVAHPNFTGEYVSVHPPATKAIPQPRVCRSLRVTIWPIPRNLENLTVGHTLKFGIDASGALELSADAVEPVIEVLVERGGLQLRQPFAAGRCRLSALVTVRHRLAPWSCCG